MKKFLLTLCILIGLTGVSYALPWKWNDAKSNAYTYPVRNTFYWQQADAAFPANSYLATIISEGKLKDWSIWDKIHLGTWKKFDLKWHGKHGSANIKWYKTGPTNDTTPVPEAGTMLLLGFGLLVLAGVSKRK